MSQSHWVAPVLLGIISMMFGLLVTMPMFDIVRLKYFLIRLSRRRRTKLGALALQPLLLSYLDNQRLQLLFFLSPLCLNVFLSLFMGFGNGWAWGSVLVIELLAVLVFLVYRHQRFVVDADAYLEMTAPGTCTLEGLIIQQEVECQDQDAQNWGRVIKMLQFEAVEGTAQSRLLFVPFPVEARSHVRDIPDSEPVRLFYRPRWTSDNLPLGVIGSVVGVQSIRSGASGSGIDWLRLLDCQAPRYR